MEKNIFLKHTGTELPIICGAMYPCSNPELIAAVAQAGGMGIVQPLSLVFVHKHDFRQGLRYIKSITDKPFGLNIITEKSSKIYQDRMKKYLDIALEEGVRFFVTSLGNPKWVVDRVHAQGGVVYHDVVDRRWALKALDSGVDGIICVNNRAGGHAGQRSLETLFNEMNDLNVPLVAAGGISTARQIEDALNFGYLGVQLGTRFIATTECNAHEDYKKAIVDAHEQDIVLTEKISGVPVSVIYSDAIKRMGLQASPIARYMLRHAKLKHWMRMFYTIQSAWKLKQASLKGYSYSDFWQAGKSVEGIESVLTVTDVMNELKKGCKNITQS